MSVMAREQVSTVVSGTLGKFSVEAKIVAGALHGGIKVMHTAHPAVNASEYFHIGSLQDLSDLIRILNETVNQLVAR